ncbi:hypothetical protein FRB93_006841 [Tulasnella sp. JGI-2019a]|nr:hypothetical protein FRB93_006841 [Tulasnella sp. JGI-2019a]
MQSARRTSRSLGLSVSNPDPNSDEDEDLPHASKSTAPISDDNNHVVYQPNMVLDALHAATLSFQNTNLTARSTSSLEPASSALSSTERLIVTVTADSEYYSIVDITGVTDAPAIRERIFSKLSIPDQEYQAYSIYRTEFGETALGDPIIDQNLMIYCTRWADDKGTLKFLVKRNPAAPTVPASNLAPSSTPLFPTKARNEISTWSSPQSGGESVVSSDRDRPPRTVRLDLPRSVGATAGAAPRRQRKLLPPTSPGPPAIQHQYQPPPVSVNFAPRSATTARKITTLIPPTSTTISTPADSNRFSRRSPVPDPSYPHSSNAPYSQVPSSRSANTGAIPANAPSAILSRNTPLERAYPAGPTYPTSSPQLSLPRVDPHHQRLNRELMDLGQYRILLQDLEIDETSVIGRGGFGVVLYGKLSGYPSPVAVKRLRSDETQDIRIAKRLVREMKAWSKLRHPNILPLIGFYLSENLDTALIVCPIQPNGNVKDYLERVNPNGLERLKLALDTLCAVEYLHNLDPPIVHGDIKALNILMSDERRAVLCDFGLVVAADEVQSGLTTSKGFKGSVRYCSPELVMEDEARRWPPSDMWAWGCLFVEIMKEIVPYPRQRNDFQVISALLRGDLPGSEDVLKDDPIKIWPIVQGCWHADPQMRSTATTCAIDVRLLMAASIVTQCTPVPSVRLER